LASLFFYKNNFLMRKILGFTALIGFILSLFVHLLSLFGVDVASIFKPIWFLHIGLFLVVVPIIFFEQKSLSTLNKFARAKSVLPRRISLSRKVLHVYAVVNFVIWVFLSEGGTPDIRDGKYILHNHGKLMRELTQNEYKLFLINKMRFFSGIWLVFYFESFAYLVYLRDKKEISANT
jgi:hypothetical protein